MKTSPSADCFRLGRPSAKLCLARPTRAANSSRSVVASVAAAGEAASRFRSALAADLPRPKCLLSLTNCCTRRSMELMSFSWALTCPLSALRPPPSVPLAPVPSRAPLPLLLLVL